MSTDTKNLYREVCVGGMAHSGQTAGIDEIMATARNHFGKPIALSYWSVPEEGKKHIESNGSLSGYGGPTSLPELVVDIDAANLEDALVLAREVVKMLTIGHDLPRAAIAPWFSGGKGYHLHLDSGLVTGACDARVPALVEVVCEHVFADLIKPKGDPDAKVDISMVRHQWPTGMIRAPWSYHGGAERYKVPLLMDELMNDPPGLHKEWAESPRKHRDGVSHPPLDTQVRPLLREAAGVALDDFEGGGAGLSAADFNGNATTTSQDDSDNENSPTRDTRKPDFITCMWHLWNRGPVDGRRHHDLERLAASLAHRGLGREQMESLLMQWLDAPEKGLPIDEEGREDCKDLAKRASGNGQEDRWTRFRCDDEIMTEFCDSHCRLYAYREEEDPLLDSEGMIDKLDEYLSVDPDEVIDLGEVFEDVSCPIHPGDIVLLIGDTKLGKSAFFQGVNLKLAPRRVLDLSMEMHPGLHTRRYLQIAHGLRVNEQKGIDEVRQALQTRRRDELKSVLDHLHIVTTSPRVDDLERLIREVQADVVLIDPLERIRVPEHSDLSGPKKVMETIKDIARRTGIIFFVVNHTNKQSQRVRKGPPKIFDSKGLKRITEEANYVFSFGGNPKEKLRRLKLLRSTHHMDLDVILKGDPETFQFWASGEPEPDEEISTADITTDLPS